MTKEEYLLTCLAEECSEVIKDVSKALRFGLNDVAPNGHSNKNNISYEMTDLLAVFDLLEQYNIVPTYNYNPDKIASKQQKVLRYMQDHIDNHQNYPYNV